MFDTAADIQRMRKVLRIFVASGVRCWVDQGSLLGLIRDETLITWDSDIDLSCWDADCPADHDVWRQLRRDGFFPMRSEDEDLTKLIWPGENESVRIIDITRYRREGDHAVRRWSKAHLKGWGRFANAFLNNTRLTARHVWSYRRGSPVRRFYAGRSFPNRPEIQRLRGWIGSLAIQFVPTGALERLATWAYLTHWRESNIIARTPASFFNHLAPITVADQEYLAPHPVEAYLEFKYGPDWQTPKREWSFADEDGAVVHDDS